MSLHRVVKRERVREDELWEKAAAGDFRERLERAHRVVYIYIPRALRHIHRALRANKIYCHFQRLF